ncbi:hypothetical protein NHX12_014045 [Muraenolepis orangiensis]|uniref:Uncharacterized protein n=1 Tax=Muraenolepis orangiensis TaxID=630683 RepID=A0A9Q0I490_9TELE|nr:hypothetical protein NHX12_014045 [Muraenolepis orangiensis]
MLWSPLLHAVSQTNDTGGGSNDGGGGGGDADANPEYIAFVLVPVFFLLGLLGVLICHILKRKGYRCTTEGPPDPPDGPWEDHMDLELGELNDTMTDNNDTVGQIVHMIMKNKGSVSPGVRSSPGRGGPC